MGFNPATMTVELTEKETTNVVQTVALVDEDTRDLEGIGSVITYDIESVTCDQASEFCVVNGQPQITIVINMNGNDGQSFTFTSPFRDLFDRTFKFTRHFSRTATTAAYNSYHVTNRVRSVAQIDEATPVQNYAGIYRMVPPPASRTISFTVHAKKTTIDYALGTAIPPALPTVGAGTPAVENVTLTWAFTLLSDFNITMSSLQTAVSSGSEYIKNQLVHGDVP